MSFCTAITCIDGRIHIPVIQYLQERFNVPYVDLISEAGPNRILALDPDSEIAHSIMRRVAVSIECHNSSVVAVVGHHDCAGNSASVRDQHQHTIAAVQRVQVQLPQVEVLGLWVDDTWRVTQVPGRAEQGSN